MNYIFLADGFEEIEAVTPVDMLRRAGMPVTTVSINPTATATGAHGVPFVADTTIDNADIIDADWLILPGGMPGASNLASHPRLRTLLKSQAADGGRIAAICASPAVVLAPLGLLEGRRATAYPGFEDGLKAGGAIPSPGRAVCDGNIITANGPASAQDFALAIITASKGAGAAQAVAGGMLV